MPSRPARPDYERGLGRRLTRRYVALGADAVVMYVEPVLIRRDPSDADWVAFLAWREQPGNLVERMPPADRRSPADDGRREPTILTS